MWRGGLPPFGCEAVVKALYEMPGPLRDPTGASPLATGARSHMRLGFYSGSRWLLPSTKRAMPSGLAFFRASGNRASGQFW